MKSFIQEGSILSFVAGADYASGAPVVLGSIIGLVVASVLNGAVGQALVSKCATVSKVSAQAWTMGQRVYYDQSLALFTTLQDTDTIFAGVAIEAAANPSSTGKLALSHGDPQAATVAALAQTISGTYVAAEVQAISTKVDAILTALKNAGLMA